MKSNKILFKAKLISTGEYVTGTYHYSNDGKYHYILNRECFIERTYDTSNEMVLKKEEVHLVDENTVVQIINDDVVLKLQKLLEQAISDISNIHSDSSHNETTETTTQTANQLWRKLEEIQEIIDNEF